MANMPSGTRQERSACYSKKHKLHGYKTEVSVLPTGLAINCSSHFKGPDADITIFRKNKDFHMAASTKPFTDDNMPDDGPLHDKYPESWINLADKGYQGLAEEMRVLIPTRRKPSTPLTNAEEAVNCKISLDRVVVENYFGPERVGRRVLAGKNGCPVIFDVDLQRSVLVVLVSAAKTCKSPSNVILVALEKEAANQSESSSNIQKGTLVDFHKRLGHLNYDAVERLARDPSSGIYNYTRVFLAKTKDAAAKKFVHFLVFVDKRFDCSIHVLRTYSGGVYEPVDLPC
ncbi:hypothetical protein PHMEG_00019405 [Phytophthora megakarya]|uniref:DDE Tnp4 domain-containing protein n=1 Tax=Phytophthora megakarya TaxID=4795 RepID=A0A225VTI6_9STRA|nr:hypothetical protein PHMEG_00019405 [Phytophthora megakarya]